MDLAARPVLDEFRSMVDRGDGEKWHEALIFGKSETQIMHLRLRSGGFCVRPG